MKECKWMRYCDCTNSTFLLEKDFELYVETHGDQDYHRKRKLFLVIVQLKTNNLVKAEEMNFGACETDLKTLIKKNYTQFKSYLSIK